MFAAPVAYRPRDPTSGSLHRLIEEWWPKLEEELAASDLALPEFVSSAIEDYLKCGRFEEGFILLRCRACGLERALAFACKTRGLCPSCGARRMHDVAHHLVERVLPERPLRQYVLSPPAELVGLLAARGDALSALARIFVRCVFAAIAHRVAPDAGSEAKCGAVVLIQRFTKSLAIFPHLHVLVLDGAFLPADEDHVEFTSDRGPSAADLVRLEDEVHRRFAKWLKRHGYLDEPDAREHDAWFAAGAKEPSGQPRIAGARRDTSRFQVHAGVRVAAGDEEGRKRLCLYAARPPLAEAQLEVLDEERVRLHLRSPTPPSRSTIVLHPLSLVRRLAWLIAPPRQHQLRYAGVFAPASPLRSLVVPAGRVAVQRVVFGPRAFEPLVPVEYRAPWRALLARVYNVDGLACPSCAANLHPVNAVLPPRAGQWFERGRILPLTNTGPPNHQLLLPIAG